MPILHQLGQTDLRRTKPGMYGDGGGLWLQITKSTAGHANRSWIFRYGRNGRRREMGLGPTYIVGLRDAREEAAALRKLVYEGRRSDRSPGNSSGWPRQPPPPRP